MDETTKILKFELDLTNVQQADDGNTTHYGGFYVLNGEEKRATGDDRSWSYIDDIMKHIQLKAEEAFGESIDEEVLLDAIQEVSHATIVVAFQGGSTGDYDNFVVTVES